MATVSLLVIAFLSSKASELSEPMSTSAESYSSYIFSFIPSTSFVSLNTRLLLICTSFWCQSQICLLWLTRYVGPPHPVMAIASYLSFDKLAFDCRLIIAIAFPRYIKLSIKRFCFFLASVIIFLSYISIIIVRLL